MARIVLNRVRCKRCGDIIESKHRYDFVWCRCQAIAVDGGLDYLRRVGTPDTFEDISELEDDAAGPPAVSP